MRVYNLKNLVSPNRCCCYAGGQIFKGKEGKKTSIAIDQIETSVFAIPSTAIFLVTDVLKTSKEMRSENFAKFRITCNSVDRFPSEESRFHFFQGRLKKESSQVRNNNRILYSLDAFVSLIILPIISFLHSRYIGSNETCHFYSLGVYILSEFDNLFPLAEITFLLP